MPRYGPLTAGAHTDRGMVRDENEDSYRLPDAPPELIAQRGLLFAVADGVGGYGNGREASDITLQTLYDHFYGPEPVDLTRIIQLASMAVRRRGLQGGDHSLRMGSTLVLALFSSEGVLVAHVGDSRAYLARQGSIARLTNDHSLVAEQVAAGLLTEDQARAHERRNVITRAMGAEGGAHPDISQFGPLLPGDVVVLCTDGLTSYVDDTTIAQVVASQHPEQAAPALVQLANQGGGADNITVQVIRYEPTPGPTPAAAPRRGRNVALAITVVLFFVILTLVGVWIILI